MTANVQDLRNLKLEKLPKLFKLSEYLRKEDAALDKYEYYNGEIIKMGNTKFNHNLIASNTIVEVTNKIDTISDAYFVLGDGQKVYIESANVCVYPDGLVISSQPQFYGGREEMITNPIVVIEILSRSTAGYDRHGKFDYYRMLPSFQEYVLIDSRKHSVETRFREEFDLWRIRTETSLDAVVNLKSIGINISLNALYKKVVFNKK